MAYPLQTYYKLLASAGVDLYNVGFDITAADLRVLHENIHWLYARGCLRQLFSWGDLNGITTVRGPTDTPAWDVVFEVPIYFSENRHQEGIKCASYSDLNCNIKASVLNTAKAVLASQTKTGGTEDDFDFGAGAINQDGFLRVEIQSTVSTVAAKLYRFYAVEKALTVSNFP